MNVFFQRAYNILRSRRLFWAIVAFFAIEATWIALSAVYPQGFDERFHFGLIKIYAHYWLPFLSNQPPDANAYGAVPRDASYLYHYLMSFPYRLISLAIHSQTNQVILLRFINIALAATGLVLFRRVLLRARLSPAFVNVSLLLFVLIPIVPQLAGQVNYDNMLFPLIAWACLLTMHAYDELSKRKVPTKTIVTLLAVCIVATLVKYEFLPMFAAIGLFLLYVVYRQYRDAPRQFWAQLWQNWLRLSQQTHIILVTALIISLGLFVQRDGVNLVKYHRIEPDCSKVLSVQLCKTYGPWGFSYEKHKSLETYTGTIHFYNPLQYTGWWLYWLWYRSFFAVNGPATDFRNYPPLPLPAAASIVIAVSGLVAVGIWGRRIFADNPYLLLFALIVVIYLAALWVVGYIGYRHTNFLVMMNGRYVLPILPFVAAIMAQPLALLLRNIKGLKVSIAIIVLLLFLQGGGAMTFILRSDPSWDWPNSAVVSANNTARKILKPIIVEGKKTYTTRVWMFR